MLIEGNRLRRQGVDVVIGYVEPHDRPETTAQIGDLEIVPPLVAKYRDYLKRNGPRCRDCKEAHRCAGRRAGPYKRAAKPQSQALRRCARPVARWDKCYCYRKCPALRITL